jgi:predicted dehydrogenase
MHDTGEPIRVGVVGLGGRGLGWIRNLQRVPGFRIVAVCDPIAALHPPALAALAAPDGVAVYERYDDLLGDANVESVALCVRCEAQGAMAAQALEAGKHVSAEVPAAHTLEDCWRIVLAAERSGRVYHLAEQTRYWGFVEAWRALVAAGRLGRITLCEGQYFHYRPNAMFKDFATGRFFRPDEVAAHPEARPTWSQLMPPIHYLPHELSPMLKVLDDRVTEVVAMSTGSPSYAHPEIAQPDMQMALMKTERGAILRLAKSSAQPHPERNYHWYQVLGTRGRVEWKRADRDRPKLWLADGQMHDLAAVDWRYERADAPPEARSSGHGDADYYVHVAFRDAVLAGRPAELDVYGAMDTAAPAILAAASIARGGVPLAVPDFRPGPGRPAGTPPGAA